MQVCAGKKEEPAKGLPTNQDARLPNTLLSVLFSPRSLSGTLRHGDALWLGYTELASLSEADAEEALPTPSSSFLYFDHGAAPKALMAIGMKAQELHALPAMSFKRSEVTSSCWNGLPFQWPRSHPIARNDSSPCNFFKVRELSSLTRRQAMAEPAVIVGMNSFQGFRKPWSPWAGHFRDLSKQWLLSKKDHIPSSLQGNKWFARKTTSASRSRNIHKAEISGGQATSMSA